jgi:hypothetical protein
VATDSRVVEKSKRYQSWSKRQNKWATLDTFTREELLSLAMRCMDVIDRVDSKIYKTGEIIEEFIRAK